VQNGDPLGHLGEKREPVVAELELRTVLMEAPVRLDAFPARRGDVELLDDGCGSLFDPLRLVVNHSFQEFDPGQPDAVLRGHSGLRAVEDRPEFFPQRRGALVAEQDDRLAESHRGSDALVPPVRAGEIVLRPVFERADRRIAGFGFAVKRRSIAAVGGGEDAGTVVMSARRPAPAAFVGIIDILPGAVRLLVFQRPNRLGVGSLRGEAGRRLFPDFPRIRIPRQQVRANNHGSHNS